MPPIRVATRGDGGGHPPVLYLWGTGQNERVPEPAAGRQSQRGQDVRFKFLPIPQERFFDSSDDLVEILASADISTDIDILTDETVAHRDRSVIRLAAGLWNLRFWGASALSGDVNAAGQILKVEVAEDDAVLTTNLGYGTPVPTESAVAMVLEMDIEELELDGSEQLTFAAFGVNNAGGNSWSCFLRLEKQA